MAKKKEVVPVEYIPTGSTLLNCALSDKWDGGYAVGKIINSIGDQSSGKTILALTCFAEMSVRKEFDDYLFVFDDAEAADEFNLEYLFGEKATKRINEGRLRSKTVEDFYENILKTIRKEQPFVYVLDSLDTVGCVAEEERADDYAEGKKVGGSFKAEKPKMLSEILRNIHQKIEDTGSLLNVISQTRDNLGFGAQFTPKKRSGGKALHFYACHEIWLARKQAINKKGLVIGSEVNAKVEKNKITGKKRGGFFSIYPDYGVDNTASCVDYLVDKKYWKKDGAIITAHDFGLKFTKDKLVREIEEKKKEIELQQLVGDVWLNVEEAVKLNRKRKY